MEMKQKYWLYLLVLVFLIVSGIMVFPYISALLSAAAIAYILYPFHLKLRKKVGGMLSSLTFVSVLFVAVVSMIAYGISFLVYKFAEIQAFVYSSNDLLEKIEVIDLTSITNQVLDKFSNYIFSMSTQITHYALLLFIFFIALYYFLLHGKEIFEYINKVIPISKAKKSKLFSDIKRQINAIVYVQFILGIIQGVVGGIALYLLGYEFALFGAILMGILGIIPILGPFIFYIPVGLFSMASGDINQGIALIIVGLLVVSTVDNFLRPFMVGKRAQVHPLIVLVGLFGGIAVFGVAGILVGPIILSITLTMLKDLREFELSNSSEKN